MLFFALCWMGMGRRVRRESQSVAYVVWLAREVRYESSCLSTAARRRLSIHMQR